MFVVKASGKCELHTYFTFLQRILNSTHMKKFNIFCIIYVAMYNFQFSGLDNVNMTCITQVSFKITIRKKHVYIDIRWPWKLNQYFYLAIWEDERFKIIFLPSFQLVTRLNSQNRNETSLLMNSDTLISIWILAFPIGIIQVSTPRKWSFLLYFSSLLDYWPLTTFISLVHNSLGEMEWCEKRTFQLLEMRKMSQPKHKNQVRNRLFIDS